MLRTREADPVRQLGRLSCLLALVAVIAAARAGSAHAVILPPTTIDGPSTAILEFGGVAMAADGTGGLVYTKVVEGAPHVFAARYDGNAWGTPVRVDSEGKFEATEPTVSAGSDGRLMVVWVTPVATVHGKIRRGLMSATVGPGAEGFGPATVVDPNVGEEAGVAPALAGFGTGKATVAYRVVTENFRLGKSNQNAVQLHPGDVIAEIRVARLNGDRWSRLGAINRNPAASLRPPSPTNGPQVAIGATGNAVIAWQEPDQTGAARVWVRRVFAASIGPPILASPSTWESRPVVGEASAFSLAVTRYDQARLVSRVVGEGGEPTRLFLGTLEPNYKEGGAKLIGPVQVGGGSSEPGVPAVAAGGSGGGEGQVRMAYASGGSVALTGVDEHGGLTDVGSLGTPPPSPGAEVVTSVGAEGGGVTAYESTDTNGLPAVAVRQEFPEGEAQSGVVEGDVEGPVADLATADTEAGDALLGFRQGEPGSFEIVGDRISAPPTSFALKVPKKWVKPGQALLRWAAAPTSVGGINYAVVLNGRVVSRQLAGLRFKPRAALLGSGIGQVKVIATDAFGGQVVSATAKLKVDAEPPLAAAKSRGLSVAVKLSDAESGVARARCLFGEGSKPVASRRVCRHRYPHEGTFPVVVHERDRAGNAIVRHLRVKVR